MLSKQIQDSGGSGRTDGPTLVYPSEIDAAPKISIPTFAMASYKLKGSIWMKKGVGETQQVSSFLQAAYKWLRLVQCKLDKSLSICRGCDGVMTA
ncbi:hypothetical protein ACSQ67_003947 [Phaseolus vulgaris]